MICAPSRARHVQLVDIDGDMGVYAHSVTRFTPYLMG